MHNTQILASLFFSPPERSFWRWSGDAQVLTWTDGATIAFRPEVECVLARLAPQGLPPFPAVVLLLAACRERWQGHARESLIALDPFLERFGKGEASTLPQWLAVVLESLEAVSALRPELRTGAEAKALLAEVVFEAARGRGTADDAARIVRSLAEGLNPEILSGEAASENAFHSLLQDLEVLREGLAGLDAEALALRAKTGLERMIAPAKIDLDPADRVRQLLVQLRHDCELGGLSRLASDLMAAVHVPRAVSTPDELPLGGVSDISNRGALDRLLTSELAHDDLTFAVRVAMNEALYLRRESPPRTPPGRRLILLDSGIRMWGLPRAFAAAVALALAATADRCVEVLCYRVKEDGLEPVDLTTREGLVAHLEAIESDPHPGRALEPFLALAHEGSAPVDAILVTHAEAPTDPEFAPSLAALGDRALYVATVDRDGAFRLFSWSRRGGKRLREAKLALDDLLLPPPAAGRPGTPLVAAEIDPDLPVILFTEPFPLLLPHPVDPRRALYARDHGVVALTQDGRVLHWKRRGEGARQLTAMAPRGTLLGQGLEPGGLAWFVVGGFPGPRVRLIAADLRTGECAVHDLVGCRYPPVAVTAHLGALFLIYRRQVEVFSLANGERAEALQLPSGVRWRCGRFFFQGSSVWHALAFDGLTGRLEAVPLGEARGGAIVALYDRRGRDGPWAVCGDSSIVCLASGARLGPFLGKSSTWVDVPGISRDGDRLLLRARGAAKTETFLIDLESGKTGVVHGSMHAALEPEILKLAEVRYNLRRKFLGVHVDEDGRLCLLSTKGYLLSFVPDSRGKEWMLQQRGTGDGRRRSVAGFAPASRPPKTGYDLQAASWKDGSRAYLDSRGLLHLRSSDPALPQITFVLTDPPAGWSSDGRRCGPAYFHGDAGSGDGAPLQADLERFMARLR